MYEYGVRHVARVIDGDTFDLDLDLGFYATIRVRVRLVGVDAYEVYGIHAHPLGPVAQRHAAHWMDGRLAQGALAVQTLADTPSVPPPDGGFGRWAGIVFDLHSGERLADSLRHAGLVHP